MLLLKILALTKMTSTTESLFLPQISNTVQKLKILNNAIPLIFPGPQIPDESFHTHQNKRRLLISTKSQNELPLLDHNLTVTKLLYIWTTILTMKQ